MIPDRLLQFCTDCFLSPWSDKLLRRAGKSILCPTSDALNDAVQVERVAFPRGAKGKQQHRYPHVGSAHLTEIVQPSGLVKSPIFKTIGTFPEEIPLGIIALICIAPATNVGAALA